MPLQEESVVSRKFARAVVKLATVKKTIPNLSGLRGSLSISHGSVGQPGYSSRMVWLYWKVAFCHVSLLSGGSAYPYPRGVTSKAEASPNLCFTAIYQYLTD